MKIAARKDISRASYEAELGLLSALVGKHIPDLSSRDFSVIAAVARFSASAFELYLRCTFFCPSFSLL